MTELMLGLHPALLAMLAACLTWAVTAAGSLTVFLLPRRSDGVMPALLAASAGVMLAASYWSLLAPAIEAAPLVTRLPVWCVAAAGFLAGGLFLAAGEKLPELWREHRQGGQKTDSDSAQDGYAARRRAAALVGAVTLHNIPEGMAIGVAFGSLTPGQITPAALAGAVSVAVGIGLQNFPEGAAVALPLVRGGCSRRRAFWLGQLSGVVEPLAACCGALLVGAVRSLLPWMMAGAAGAMIYVAAHELLPQAQRPAGKISVTLACLAGFAVMMALDVGLG